MSLPTCLISADAENLIIAGSDGKLYGVPPDTVGALTTNTVGAAHTHAVLSSPSPGSNMIISTDSGGGITIVSIRTTSLLDARGMFRAGVDGTDAGSIITADYTGANMLLGFYGTTPVVKPSGVSAGNALMQLGLADSIIGDATFVSLTDTPGSYIGEALRTPRVVAGEIGLEFADYVEANEGGEFIGDVAFSGNVGFYGTLPVAQPTGVTATTALEQLGLGNALITEIQTFLGLQDTPVDYTGFAGQMLVVNQTEDGVEFDLVPVIIDTFTGLTDTPGAYAGFAGQILRVNATEDGLEYVDLPVIVDTFIGLTDTPNDYAGQSGKMLIVNGTEDALEYAEVPVIISTFLGLTDTPADYAGQAGKLMRVNQLENAVEYGDYSFLELADTPVDYAGSAGMTPTVTVGEDALEFVEFVPRLDGGVFEGNVAFNKYVGFYATPPVYQLSDVQAAEVLMWTGLGANIHRNMVWRGTWAAGEYKADDVTRDGAWTMVANKDTTERAAPQPIGSTDWLIPDEPVWNNNTHTGALKVATKVSGLSSLYKVDQIRIWIADVSPAVSYRMYEVDNNTGKVTLGQVVSGGVLSTPGWLPITYTGPNPWLIPGSDVSYVLQIVNTASETTQTAPYIYIDRDRDGPEVDPGSGGITYNRDTYDVRISNTDRLGTDQVASGLLDSLVNGTTITVTQDDDGTNWLKFTVTDGYTVYTNHYTYACVFDGTGPGGRPDRDSNVTITFDIPTYGSVNYVSLTGYWGSNISINGLIQFDDTPPLEGNDAYGVDLYVTEYELPLDWDALAFSGAGGASGGSGVDTFDDLTDTPADKTGQAGKYVRVTADELSLEYVPGSGGGANTFLELTDTPADYTGQSLRPVIVNTAEDALIHQTTLSIDDSTAIVSMYGLEPTIQFKSTDGLTIHGTVGRSALSGGHIALDSWDSYVNIASIPDAIYFSTNNTTRMTVAYDGKVGIGTSTPSARLHLLNNISTNENSFNINHNFNPTSASVVYDACISMTNIYDSSYSAGGFSLGNWIDMSAIGSGNRSMRGIDINIKNKGSGTSPSVVGISIRTIDNIGGGNITTAYGLLIRNQNKATNNYAIYTQGGGIYHAGNMAIGTSVSTSYKLRVGGGLTELQQEGWNNVSFQNGWVNYGVVYNNAGYFKDSNGVVHLRGLIRNGTIGSVIFNLPAGYRPVSRELFSTISINGYARVDVNTNGDVIHSSFNGANGWVSLDGLTFKAI